MLPDLRGIVALAYVGLLVCAIGLVLGGGFAAYVIYLGLHALLA